MEIIINYFKAALKALLVVFGVETDEEVMSNIESMLNNLFGFEPENKAE